MEAYDSTADTRKHIETVKNLLTDAQINIDERRLHHDDSKLQEPEKSMYDKFTPMLRGLTYGSDEYKKCLADMGPALAHHYANNSHHPEHYRMFRCPVCQSIFSEKDAPIATVIEGDTRICPTCSPNGVLIFECALVPESGIHGMSLLDLIEMLADWKAAGMRHADGDMQKSLEINRKRFGVSDQLFAIFQNTIKEMGW